MLSPRLKLLILPVAAVAVASCSKTTTRSGGVPTLDARKAGKVGDGTLERLGDRALKQGRPGMAAGFYARALHRKPREVSLHKKLGFALFKSRNYAASEKAFKQAMVLSPNDTEVMRGRANALIATGRAGTAIPIYTAAIAKSGRHADYRLHNGLGVAYDALGRHNEAQTAYRQGLAANAGNLTLRNNLALSLSASGAHGRAVELLTAVAASSKATDRHRANLARVRAKAGAAGVKMATRKGGGRKAGAMTGSKSAMKAKSTKDKKAPKAVKRRRMVKAAEKPVNITRTDAKAPAKKAGAAVKGSEAKAGGKKSFLLNLMKSKRKMKPSAKDLSRGFEPASGTADDIGTEHDSTADDAFIKSMKGPVRSRKRARRSARYAARRMAARKLALSKARRKASMAKSKPAKSKLAKSAAAKAKPAKRNTKKAAVSRKRPAHLRTARRLNKISTAAGAAERTEELFK